MNTTTQERLHALDGLRAVMMLLGLVLHSLDSYTVTDLGGAWPFKDAATSAIADNITRFIHVFRMPVFFVLAGFFAALLYSRRGPLELVRNRWQRIGVPFVIFLLLIKPLVTSGFVFANAIKTGTGTAALEKVLSSSSDPAFYLPNSTVHLWFIYYLLQFYLIALAVAWVAQRQPTLFRTVPTMFSALLSNSVLRLLLPAAITTLCLLPMNGSLATSTAFTPNAAVLVTYLVFFGFGWLLYAERHRLQSLCTSAWTKVLIAIALFEVVFLYIAVGGGETALGSWANMLRSVTGGIVVWLVFYGSTGLFLRYLNQPSGLVRWIVDASYWVYLVHLPVTIWVPGMLAQADLPALVKALITLCSTLVLSVGTYWLFVRTSAIGALLNGRKQPRGFAVV